MSSNTKTAALKKLLYSRKLIAKPNISTARPKVTSVLKQSLNADLNKTVDIAVKTKSLENKNLAASIAEFRKAKRFDKVDQIVRQAQKSGLVLDKSIVSATMACANESNRWQDSLRYFSSFVKHGGHTNNTHLLNTALSSLRIGNQTEQAFSFYEQLLKAQHADAYTLHVILTVAKNTRNWERGAKCYLDAWNNGTVSVNGATHLQYLRLVEGYIKAVKPNAKNEIKKMSMDAVQNFGKFAESRPQEIQIGHINSVLTCLLSSGSGGPTTATRIMNVLEEKWAKNKREIGEGGWYAVEGGPTPFETSLLRTIQKLDCVPNAGTYQAFFSGQTSKVSLDVSLGLLQSAIQKQIPLSSAMYRSVLSDLIKTRGAKMAADFVNNEIDQATTAVTGDGSHSLRQLYIGLADALLESTDDEGVKLLLEEFTDQLEGIVGDLVGGAGVMGQAHERWVVEGRVGVVDDSAFFSQYSTSLPDRFDSVFIPFSVARKIYRNRELEPKFSKYWKNAASNLNNLILNYPDAVRILPFTHQLAAQRTARSRTTLSEALSQNTAAHKEVLKVTNDHHEDIPTIRSDADAIVHAATVGSTEISHKVKPTGLNPNLFRYWNIKTSTVAVGVSLQRLNPDAEIIVLGFSAQVRSFALLNGLAAAKLNANELKFTAPTALEVKNAMNRSKPAKPLDGKGNTRREEEIVDEDEDDIDGMEMVTFANDEPLKKKDESKPKSKKKSASVKMKEARGRKLVERMNENITEYDFSSPA